VENTNMVDSIRQVKNMPKYGADFDENRRIVENYKNVRDLK
jgi:ribosomal protein S17E